MKMIFIIVHFISSLMYKDSFLLSFHVLSKSSLYVLSQILEGLLQAIIMNTSH